MPATDMNVKETTVNPFTRQQVTPFTAQRTIGTDEQELQFLTMPGQVTRLTTTEQTTSRPKIVPISIPLFTQQPTTSLWDTQDYKITPITGIIGVQGTRQATDMGLVPKQSTSEFLITPTLQRTTKQDLITPGLTSPFSLLTRPNFPEFKFEGGFRGSPNFFMQSGFGKRIRHYPVVDPLEAMGFMF